MSSKMSYMQLSELFVACALIRPRQDAMGSTNAFIMLIFVAIKAVVT